MRHIILSLFGFLLLAGCSTLQPNFENPSLEVVSISMLPSEGVEAKFDIGLRVSNPNRMSLNIVGLSYDLSLEGFKVIQGVGNDIPEIPGYGAEQFHITATTNLLQSFKLIAQLLNNPKNTLNYKFGAKLDLGATWLPALRLSDTGEINLSQGK